MIRCASYIFITLLLLFLPFKGYAQYVPGQSYFGANNYIEYIAGDLPIIIVAPHGGTLEPETLPTISEAGRDLGTFETTHLLKDSITTQTGGYHPHVIINLLKPGKMNPVSDIDSAAGEHPDARQAWNDFHDFIEDAKSEVTNTWLKGHYFEMHGNGHSEMWNEIGLGVSKTYLNDSDSVIRSRTNYSTIRNLCTIGGADFLEVIRGSTSLGGLLDARGWKSVTSPSYPAPGDGGFFYAGWNTWLHGSRYSGTIDATHLETYYVFMQSANRVQYANDLAESILIFMETHYGFDLSCPELYDNAFSGDIIAHVTDIINNMPATSDADDYVEPDSAARNTWRTIVQNIIFGDYCAAHADAPAIDYQVVMFTDNTTTPNIIYYVLERALGATSNYWGTFIYNPSPLRQKLFIQSPHPLNDTNTGMEGLDIFRYCGALAYFTSGTHRCNSTVSSPCSGTTTTCSGFDESYRNSDQAHVTQSTLQITTEELESAITNIVIIQPHGFSKDAGDPDLILSNGTRDIPSPDYLVSLQDNLTALDNTLTFKVGHIDLEWSRLLGTTNMQGRYINGVASPCSTSASTTTGRFLHVEQAYSKLRDNRTNWNKVVNAVGMTIPLDTVLTNSNVLEFDGYNDYAVYPNDVALQKLDGASDYTLEAWLFIADESDINEYDVIINRDNSFMIQLRSNLRVSFRILKSDSTWAYYNSTENAMTIGQWNHIAVIRNTEPDPNTLKIFVNGTDVSGSWWGYDMRSDGGDLYIGKRSNDTNYLKGYIDEIRLKDNAEDSENLHSGSFSSLYSWDGNTAAIFHFDEDFGPTVTSNEAGHQAVLGSSDVGDSAEPTWRYSGFPLLVDLVSFTATALENHVILEWETASEIDTAGFHLWRSETNGGEYARITDYLIPAEGSPSWGAEYEYDDLDVEPGRTYFYKLEDIDYSGDSTFHGPVRACVGVVDIKANGSDGPVVVSPDTPFLHRPSSDLDRWPGSSYPRAR